MNPDPAAPPGHAPGTRGRERALHLRNRDFVLESLATLLIFFAEPGFPNVGGAADVRVPDGALVVASVEALSEALEPGRILVWRHGSAFPADAWPALVQFLEEGGSFLHLGGEPFTRPVVGPSGARRVLPRTVSLLKTLRLNQSYRCPVGGAELEYVTARVRRTVPEDSWVAILEPRFSDTKDFATEDGAPGSRDAILRPLSFLHRPGDDRRFPTASGSFAIDRLRGRFAGGRWVFHLLSGPVPVDELELLVAEVSRAASDFRVDPTLGCYHPGERPTVMLRLVRPRARDIVEREISLEIQGPDGETSTVDGVALRAGRHGTARVSLPFAEKPGLYRVTARAAKLGSASTGFWIFDRKLFTSGPALTFDDYTLRRDGKPEPVIGTTTMSASVHRKFLFEPNAAEWDDTFRELASIGVNLVRTGVWSAYRKISLDPHVVDEAWLRALEAYYLSAWRHGIPIIFTFFAFVPEAFGGDNPYFDPRSLEGQRAYLSVVAERFADARGMMWDLINEPSFSSPEKLWLGRPHGDHHERGAFLAWLKDRYGPGHEDRVRARWRLRPGDPIGVPADADYLDRHVFGDHRPYRAKEFSHFAQDAFAAWIAEMIDALRSAGSPAPVTVGQDEGGLFERPSPLFHHQLVDFTSIHTWWFNDALLWDGLMAKAPRTPLLVSETGIMQRERLSGEALRTPERSARLLSRKIGYAFAAGAFGLVEWLYEVNPYMASDNEVGIGLRRVDGSYKPEHAVLRGFAGFVARNKRWFEKPREPEVVLLFPSGDHYSPRSLQADGTRRAVETLVAELGVAVQIVPEYRTRDLGHPKLIVLPATRGISEGAWERVRRAAERGAHVLTSGYFEADDAGLPAPRVGGEPRTLARVEPWLDEDEDPLRYALSVTESCQATDHDRFPLRLPIGQGEILHYPVPLEWTDGPNSRLRSVYAQALRAAGVQPPDIRPAMNRRPPGVLMRVIEFEHSRLVVAVNDSSRDARIPIERAHADGNTAPLGEIFVAAGRARLYLFDAQGSPLDSSP